MAADLLLYPDQCLIRQWEKDPDKFEHLLFLFQNWLRYQTHLPQEFCRTMLAHFLRSCKMDLEKAKRKFEIYCYLPQTYKKLYANKVETLERDLECLNYAYMSALPELTEDGCRITMSKVINVEKCNMLSFYRTATLLAAYRLHKEIFVTGDIVVCDLEHARPQFYGKYFTPLLLHFLRISMEAYPYRVKKVFILSCHPLMEKGVNLCKAILPEKIRDRIYFIHNPGDLYKQIPAKYLPSDYNGEQDSLAVLTKKWKDTLLKNTDLFKATDDVKPTGPVPKHIPVYDNNFGVDGSFRRLNID